MRREKKFNRVMLGVFFIFLAVFSLALTIGSQTTARWLVALAQTDETLTITTYYPSPSGSYLELQTQVLHFQENMAGNGLISFNYPDAVYDKRLRITAGATDNGDNDQGASIDLHGNMAAVAAGNLDLVAGRNAAIRFFTSATPNPATEVMQISSIGQITIGGQAGLVEIHSLLGPADLVLIEGAPNNNTAAITFGSWNVGGVGGWRHKWSIGSDLLATGTENFSIMVPGSSSPAFYINAVGSVGIGTTNPFGRLQVAGDEVRIGDAGTLDYVSGDGDLYVEDQLEVDNSITTQNLTVNGTASIGWEYKRGFCANCKFVSATCSSGKKLLGGGCSGFNGPLVENAPAPPNYDTVWNCETTVDTPWLNAIAICANVSL